MAERGVVLSLDEGTTGATAVVVGLDGEVRSKGYREITQHYPQPAWVEHDPLEIWSAAQAAAQDALRAAEATPGDVRAVGITNQRETLVVWDRRTLEPLAPAIVWQDRRTAAMCDRLRQAGHEERVREVTGLVLDPYFTATKLAWVMENVAGAANAAVGTVDSWLIARLSAGRDHVTDASNASRTSLFDIGRGVWSDEMAALFGVPLFNLPEVRDSSGEISRSDPAAFGGIDAPISGIAGDQQAALFGQACLSVGMAKNTYGTGSFVLMQTGAQRVASTSGMLTTVAWRRGGNLSYALEGAIFITGAALQWLRDGLGLISSASEAGPLASSVPDAGAAVMDVLCQLQADLLGIPVRRPKHTETTALGAAFLAGLGAGVWSESDLAHLWKLDREFEPVMSRDQADHLQARWRQAVDRSLNWAEGAPRPPDPVAPSPIISSSS